MGGINSSDWDWDSIRLNSVAETGYALNQRLNLLEKLLVEKGIITRADLHPDDPPQFWL